MNRCSASLSPGKQELALLDRNSISNAFSDCVSENEGEMKSLNTVNGGKEELYRATFLDRRRPAIGAWMLLSEFWPSAIFMRLDPNVYIPKFVRD